ncbi:MAG: flagellar export protein FliJ [Ramlibacter sp.]|jgi:flagellar export protein FliJ
MLDTALTRDAWSLLVYKAQQSLEARQQQLAQARARQVQIEASEKRLAHLLQEYCERQQASLFGGQLMADSLNDRQFIAQLQRLLDQARLASAAAVRQTESDAAAVADARRELEKAEKLRAKARSEERARQERRAQARQDEWAMMRFGRQDA